MYTYCIYLLTLKYFLYYRTLNKFQLYHVLSFLHPKPMRLVCKYWTLVMQNRGMDPEGREEDDFDDDKDKSKDNPTSTSSHQTKDDERNTKSDGNEEEDRSVNGGVSASGRITNNLFRAKTVPLASQIVAEETSKSARNTSGEPLTEQQKLDLEELTHSSDENHDHEKVEKTINGVKSKNKYRNEVISYLKGSLSTMSRKEDMKTHLKKQIDDWKKEFQRKHKREPSDEEKVNGISPLFREYARVCASASGSGSGSGRVVV